MGTWVVRLAPDGVGPRLAVKDCIDVAGLPTTAGCPVVAEMAEPAANDAAGTDTGGSIRIPAACCGVVGLKTTFGRVSVKGVYPLAPSLDTVGPIGPDVAAAELGMRLIEPGFSVRPIRDLTAGRLTVTGVEGGVDPAIDAACWLLSIDLPP